MNVLWSGVPGRTLNWIAGSWDGENWKIRWQWWTDSVGASTEAQECIDECFLGVIAQQPESLRCWDSNGLVMGGKVKTMETGVFFTYHGQMLKCSQDDVCPEEFGKFEADSQFLKNSLWKPFSCDASRSWGMYVRAVLLVTWVLGNDLSVQSGYWRVFLNDICLGTDIAKVGKSSKVEGRMKPMLVYFSVGCTHSVWQFTCFTYAFAGVLSQVSFVRVKPEVESVHFDSPSRLKSEVTKNSRQSHSFSEFCFILSNNCWLRIGMWAPFCELLIAFHAWKYPIKGARCLSVFPSLEMGKWYSTSHPGITKTLPDHFGLACPREQWISIELWKVLKHSIRDCRRFNVISSSQVHFSVYNMFHFIVILFGSLQSLQNKGETTTSRLGLQVATFVCWNLPESWWGCGMGREKEVL